MTDLTEQWKKGELPSGWYYTKIWKGCDVIDKFVGNQFLRYDDSDIIEVLAPVPSYEEWQEKQKSLKVLGEAYCKEKEENQQLKELLKEAKDIIEWYKADCGYKDTPTEAVLTKIDNAIGEKK